MLFPAALAFLGFAFALSAAQTPIFPLKDVRAGMRGVGRTVFSGYRIEEFQVDVLGVLENVGPKQSLILARLSGGPLGHTGVLQGMSGSPVYLDGKLAGAVAMAFPFSKDSVCGIRPIEDILRVPSSPGPPAPLRAASSLGERDLTRVFPVPEPVSAGEARMTDLATPVNFGGFTRATLDWFAPRLRALGLEPRQGVSGGGSPDSRMGDPSALRPGSMISVQLMSGDLSIGADGTVTHIDGSRIYAFGHRFLSIGSTALPFARAEVLTLLPTLNVSFKLSAAREWMGAIYQDRSAAVAGETGGRAPMTPVSIDVSRSGRRLESYRLRMIDDRLLSPLLVQMALYSAIDATERVVGAATFRVTGQVVFENAPAPIKLDNMYTADNGAAALVSLSAAVPLAFVAQSGFPLKLKRIEVAVDAFDEKKQLQIDGVYPARRTVRPGETAELSIALVGEQGALQTRRVRYQVPAGAQPGPLYFTVSDAMTANMAEIRQLVGVAPRSARHVLDVVNRLRPNTRAWVRVWRADPAYQLEGEDMPDPPASVSLLLAAAQAGGVVSQTRNSRLAEIPVDVGDAVVSGSRTVQVEVKE